MKVIALINYKDYELNKDIKAGENLVDLYNKAGIELTRERIKVLEKGNASSNNKPFVEVVKETRLNTMEATDVIETADIKTDNVEMAVKPRGRKKATK